MQTRNKKQTFPSPCEATGLKHFQSEVSALSSTEDRNGTLVRQQMLICLSFPTKPHALFTGLAFHRREDNTRATGKMQTFTFLQPSTSGEKAAIASLGLLWREMHKKRRHNSQKADKDQALTQKNKTGEAAQGQRA